MEIDIPTIAFLCGIFTGALIGFWLLGAPQPTTGNDARESFDWNPYTDDADWWKH